LHLSRWRGPVHRQSGVSAGHRQLRHLHDGPRRPPEQHDLHAAHHLALPLIFRPLSAAAAAATTAGALPTKILSSNTMTGRLRNVYSSRISLRISFSVSALSLSPISLYLMARRLNSAS